MKKLHERLVIHDCSPIAEARIHSYDDKFHVKELGHLRYDCVYPFAAMHIGQSIALPISLNENTLRSRVSMQNSKSGGKKFTLIRHDDIGFYEIARIV